MSATVAPTDQPEAVAVVGAVTVSGPNTRGYYRLKWVNPDGSPGDTTGGRVLDGALAKAAEIDFCVSAAAGPKAVTRLTEIFDAYLAAGNSP